MRIGKKKVRCRVGRGESITNWGLAFRGGNYEIVLMALQNVPRVQPSVRRHILFDDLLDMAFSMRRLTTLLLVTLALVCIPCHNPQSLADMDRS